MGESEVFISLQATISSLQQRVSELEEMLQSSMEENISLVQKSARADALQQQVNRLLGDEADRQLSKCNQMDVTYEMKLAESNRTLQEKLGEALKQRDELTQAALQTQMLREMLDQKNRKTLELTRENAELRSKCQILESSSSNNSHSDPMIADFVAKNSALVAENAELRQRREFLEKQLAQAEMALRVIQSENSVYSDAIGSEFGRIDFRTIQSRIDNLAKHLLQEPTEKLAQMEFRLDNISRKVDIAVGHLSDESELRSTISELEEEIHELQDNDPTPKLLKLKLYVAELEEDNRRLQSLTS
jgi:hypothetical protein